MAKILKKIELSEVIYEFLVDAPLVAHKCEPGQFVIIRTDEYSERIPLTIADFDREAGTVTLVVQAVGNTTKDLCGKTMMVIIIVLILVVALGSLGLS